MNFVENKDLEIVNCDYKRLIEKKHAIDAANKKIKKENRRAKVSIVLGVIFFTLLVLAASGILMWLIWDSLREIENYSFFDNYPEKAPLIFKIITEAIAIVLCTSLYATGLSAVTAGKRNTKTPLVPIGDDVAIALLTEKGTVGNFKTMCGGLNVPYLSRPVRLSFDVLNEEGNEITSFRNSEDEWVIVLLPGLFRIIVDVAGRIIYQPYIDEGQEVHTLEDAYLYEKIQVRHCTARIKELEARIASEQRQHKDDLDLAHKETAMVETKLKNTQKALADSQKHLEDVVTDNTGKIVEIKTLKESVKKLNNEKTILLNDASSAKTNYLDLENLYTQEIEAKKEAQRKLEKAEGEAKVFRDELNRLSIEAERRVREKEAECRESLADEKAELVRLRQALEDEKITIQKKIDALERDCETLRGDLAKRDETIKKFKDAAKVDRQRANELEKALEGALENNRTLTQEVEERRRREADWASGVEAVEKLRASLAEANNTIAITNSQKLLLERSAHESKALAARYAKSDSEKAEIIKQLKAQLAVVTEEKKALENARGSFEARKGLDEVSAESDADIKHQLTELELQRNADVEKIKELTRQIETVTKENAALTQGNNDLRNRNRDLSNENKALLSGRDQMVAELAQSRERAESERKRAEVLQFQLDHQHSEEKQSSKGTSASHTKPDQQTEVTGAKKQSGDFKKRMKEHEENVRRAREDARRSLDAESRGDNQLSITNENDN